MAKIASLACIIICMVLLHGDDCHGAQRGNLEVEARTAYDLQDRDGLSNKSDPYMEVIAIDDGGNSVRKTSSTIQGNYNPLWFEKMDFGQDTWKKIKVRVWDNDLNPDDALSDQITFDVVLGSKWLSIDCYGGGKAYFIYTFK